MGNFFDDIFNDPFGLWKSKEEDPYVQQVETLSGNQNALLEILNHDLAKFFRDPGRVPDFDIVPGPGPLTQQQFGIGGQLAGQGSQALGQLGQPLTAQSLQAGSQPFLQSLMGQFQDQVVPQIAHQFGALDSARSSGLGQAIGRQASMLPGIAQSQFLGQRQFDTGNAFQGLGMSNDISRQQDALRQMMAQGNLQKFQMGLPGADPRTQFIPTALGIPAFGNIGMPGSQTPSVLSQLAPAIGPLMMMMSDIRMKENTQVIDSALDRIRQLKGHTYNYIGDEDRNGGVMAQDVEKVLPDAVTEIDGVKYVKYDAVIGLLVNAVNELREIVLCQHNG